MAYTTGTADSYPDLLLKIRSAAAAVGWATNASSDNRTLFLTDPQNEGFFSLRAFPEYSGREEVNWYSQSNNGQAIAVIGNTGYDNSLPWDRQPGNSIDNGVRTRSPAIARFGMTGPFTKYHIFATNKYIHVVVEIVTGIFCYIYIGTLDKEGMEYTGGQYTAATYLTYPPTPDAPDNSANLGNGVNGTYANYAWSRSYPYYSSHKIRVDNVDNSGDNFWASEYTTLGTRPAGEFYALGRTSGGYYGDGGHPDALHVGASRNSIDSSTQLVPHSIYYVGAQQRTRYIGNVPDHAVCDMDYLAPGDILTFGTDEWMVFPVYRKGPYVGNSPYSDVPGAAYTHLINTSLTMAVAFKVID